MAEDAAVLGHDVRRARCVDRRRSFGDWTDVLSKELETPGEHARGPVVREQCRRHARAEPAARRERRIVRSDKWRHAERVHRSLRIYLGYDERGGEQNYLGVKPHPL